LGELIAKNSLFKKEENRSHKTLETIANNYIYLFKFRHVEGLKHVFCCNFKGEYTFSTNTELSVVTNKLLLEAWEYILDTHHIDKYFEVDTLDAKKIEEALDPWVKIQ